MVFLPSSTSLDDASEQKMEHYPRLKNSNVINNSWAHNYDEKPDKDVQCGIAHFHPPWIQRFATFRYFFLVFGILLLSQGMYGAYFMGQLNTVEKRFEFPSKQTGILMAFNDFSHLVVVLFMSYFGGKGRKPLTLGIGMFMFASGTFIMSTPHYIYGAGKTAKAAAASAEASAKFNVTDFFKLAYTCSGLDIEKMMAGGFPSLTDGSSGQVGVNVSLQLLGGGIPHGIRNILPKSLEHNKPIPGNGSMNPALMAFSKVKKCSETHDNQVAFALLAIGKFLMGIGGSCFYSLGIAYIDDNVEKHKSAQYISWVYSSRMLGPVLGFALSALCSNIYVDLSKPDMSPRDPQWIGAWWLGILITAILMFIFTGPMLLFPKRLPDSKGEKVVYTKAKRKVNEIPILAKPKELLKALIRLWKNPVYMFILIASCIDLYTVVGFFIFLPKYMISQFRTHPGMASIFTGVIIVGAVMIGILIGGWVLKRFRIQNKGAILMTLCGSTFFGCCVIILMFVGCPNIRMSGSMGNDGLWNLSMPCNADCACKDDLRFAPVCGNDGLTYFTACHAGCKKVSGEKTSKNFTDCACIKTNGINHEPHLLPARSGIEMTTQPSPAEQTVNGFGKFGYCEDDCNKLHVYLVILFFGILITSPANIANMMVKLRCVAPEEKPLALGFGSFMMSACTFLPGPIIGGALVDSTCILWQINDCGETGACWIYDNARFRYTIHGMVGVVKACSLVFYLLAWYKCDGPYIEPPKKEADGEKDEKENEQKAQNTLDIPTISDNKKAKVPEFNEFDLIPLEVMMNPDTNELTRSQLDLSGPDPDQPAQEMADFSEQTEGLVWDTQPKKVYDLGIVDDGESSSSSCDDDRKRKVGNDFSESFDEDFTNQPVDFNNPFGEDIIFSKEDKF